MAKKLTFEALLKAKKELDKFPFPEHEQIGMLQFIFGKRKEFLGVKYIEPTNQERTVTMAETALIESKKLTPEVFKEGLEPILKEIREKALKENAGDASSETGRKAIKSLAYKVSRSKTLIDDYGKESVAEHRRICAVIDEERRKAREFLDELRDEIKRPVTEYEAAEKERIDAIQCGIQWFDDQAALAEDPDTSTEEIRQTLEALTNAEVTAELYEEFEEAAKKAKENACLKVEALIGRREKEERARQEAEAAEKAERERQEREKEEQAKGEDSPAEQPVGEDAGEKAPAPAGEAQGQWEPEDPGSGPEVPEEREAPSDHTDPSEHQRRVNNAALDALVKHCQLDEEQAKKVVAAIIWHRIPHVSIQY